MVNKKLGHILVATLLLRLDHRLKVLYLDTTCKDSMKRFLTKLSQNLKSELDHKCQELNQSLKVKNQMRKKRWKFIKLSINLTKTILKKLVKSLIILELRIKFKNKLRKGVMKENTKMKLVISQKKIKWHLFHR